MDFNVNERVRVKLTDYGRQALERQDAELWASIKHPAPPPYTPPKEDAEGWSEWQLWSLMQDLGHLCRMGGPTPFETTIQLVERKPLMPPPEAPMNAVRSMCG